MTNTDTPTAPAGQDRASQMTLLLVSFTASIFLSAALLFAVQPMFTKLVLPYLGGAPGVWSVAMVFFQAALLAGYGYAHLLTRHAPGRRSVMIHIGVMVVACIWLPLSIATNWGRAPAVGEAFWLLGLFAVSIGPPFFALAANAPLLQAWFARTDHPSAGDPYFLYAGSNIGSFLALVSYPTLIEPFIPLSAQTRLWAVGFVILILLIGACGYLLWRSPQHAPTAVPAAPAEGASTAETAPPSWRDAAIWVGLAAVPSGLLVAVTAHISTDIAAVPLLWVIPLALYLLTFVIVFSRKPVIPHWLVVEVQPIAVFFLVIVILLDPFESFPYDALLWVVLSHLLVFFICTLMCHGELARRRPASRYLTSFYMWMSFGGMIGGIAAGLVAPYVFNWIAEYPILIALTLLCRWSIVRQEMEADRYVRYGIVAVAVLVTVFGNFVLGALLAATALFWQRPLPVAAIVAFLLMGNQIIVQLRGDTTSVRSFFGVHKISESEGGYFRLLTHGTTIHGVQGLLDDDGKPLTGRPKPTGYYYEGSPIAEAIRAVQGRSSGPVRFGLIGLGTGSIACLARPDDPVRYYEIDPAVVEIAKDPTLFTFLSQCRPDVPIVLGDARLTFSEAEDASYDMIIVDAFSSDAIPIHLLTREAMAIYLKKLAPGGVVLMHVSNRHLELASVVANVANAHGMVTRVNSGEEERDEDEYEFGGTVVAAARNEADFGALLKAEHWRELKPDRRQRVWTDDYSNIVGAIVRSMSQ